MNQSTTNETPKPTTKPTRQGEASTMTEIPNSIHTYRSKIRRLVDRTQGASATTTSRAKPSPTGRAGPPPRKGLVAAAVLLLAAVLLAACSSPPSGAASAQKAKTTSFTLWESHNGGPVGDAMSALVSKFNASQSQVHVSINVTKASKKLLAAVAADNAPVLAEISHYDGTYVKGGALMSWNSLIKGDKELSKSNFVPAVWHNGEVGGQHYRLQTDVKVSIVNYNKTLFQKAGITAPPTTWAELAADAAKLKALGVIPIGWKDSSAHILPAFMSNGGTMLKGGNSVGTAVDFNTPAGVTTFSYFHNLYSSGQLIIGHGTTLREDFAAGKVAMIDGTSAGYQKTLDAVAGAFPVGAFVEPAGSTGHAYNIAQGLGFVLPKTDTPAEAQAALRFVNWWFEPAQQVYWAEHTGYPPETLAGIAAMPKSFLASHPGEAATIDGVSSHYTVPRPVSDSYKEVQSALDTTFLEIVTGKQPVQGGLASLDKTADSYMSGASAL